MPKKAPFVVGAEVSTVLGGLAGAEVTSIVVRPFGACLFCLVSRGCASLAAGLLALAPSGQMCWCKVSYRGEVSRPVTDAAAVASSGCCAVCSP